MLKTTTIFGALPFLALTTPAWSQGLTLQLPEDFQTSQIVLFSAFVATLSFSIVSFLHLTRQKKQIESDRDALAKQLANDRARSDRIESLIAADDQRIVVWNTNQLEPRVLGFLPEKCGAPVEPSTFTAFGNWLEPSSAKVLEEFIGTLKEDGTPFHLAVRTKTGSYIDTFGRALVGRIFVRFRDLSGDREVHLELEKHFAAKTAHLNSIKSLFEAIRQPVWMRKNSDGKEPQIDWVNQAYRKAVDSKDEVEKLTELLDKTARDAEQENHEKGEHFEERVVAVAEGGRKTFDIVSVPTENGSVGIAMDVSEAERAQAALNRTIATHQNTLNELGTAVVIFDQNRRLSFYNHAYRDLFDLSEVFLRGEPSDSEVIEKLRSLGKLPVEPNFRQWKNNLLKTHQSLEMQEFTWHLPDGRTLRVIASPRKTGGVTWIYENLTAQLNLESRVNVLSRLQTETLNRLSDGVAVFSSDGRLTLSNSTFAKHWDLDAEFSQTEPHINDLVDTVTKRFGNEGAWDALKMAVLRVAEERTDESGTMFRPDGSVLKFATTALIDGRTLVSFHDITDSVNFERAMTEKTEALEETAKLKSDFVQHVSYELRSPLTNIIGFAQLLSDADIGPLTEKQTEYTDYILSSSSSLLAIINDILDLATADAGVLELSLGEVSVEDTVKQAVQGLKDRLRERHIQLAENIDENIGTFIGDERRIVQILFNLLSNAIEFSEEGGNIELAASETDENLIFSVRDWGAGIPEAFLENVFERFESRGDGQRRGGAGLGLSIVKRFVELHDGTVEIESKEGVGTKVLCHLPKQPLPNKQAAE